MDGGKADHRARYVGRATASRAVHQDQGECDGGAENQTPGCTPPNRGHSGHVYGPSTGALPRGHQQRNGDRGVWTNIWRGRAGGDRLSETPALCSAFRSSERELQLII